MLSSGLRDGDGAVPPCPGRVGEQQRPHWVPISEQGNVMEIASLFGVPDVLVEAFEPLQANLYMA
jgi:hypothetical protein